MRDENGILRYNNEQVKAIAWNAILKVKDAAYIRGRAPLFYENPGELITNPSFTNISIRIQYERKNGKGDYFKSDQDVRKEIINIITRFKERLGKYTYSDAVFITTVLLRAYDITEEDVSFQKIQEIVAKAFMPMKRDFNLENERENDEEIYEYLMEALFIYPEQLEKIYAKLKATMNY